jgi:DNA-binding FadR family transcriptional regulator
MKELAAHFGVSEPLIRAALKIVADRTGLTETPAEPPPQPESEVE